MPHGGLPIGPTGCRHRLIYTGYMAQNAYPDYGRCIRAIPAPECLYIRADLFRGRVVHGLLATYQVAKHDGSANGQWRVKEVHYSGTSAL